MLKDYRANRIRGSRSFLILFSMIILLFSFSGCGSNGSDLGYSITGTILFGGAPLAGATLTLSNGPSSGVAVTDASGNYSFSGLSSGAYTMTPTLAGYTFVPPSRGVFLFGNNADGFGFNATRGSSVSTSTHTLYRNSDGTVRAWGRNNKGQLGDGTTTDSAAHVTVTGLTNVTNVAAGNEHSLALKSDGTVWAWGSNSNGQLGDGTLIDELTPVQVSQASGMTNVTAIAAGFNFSVALRSDGTVYAWGSNTFGQLGNNTTTDSKTPVAIIGGVTAIAAGVDHTVALTTAGVVWTWGNNSKGQLGNGSTVNSSIPLVAGSSILTPAVAISAGNQFTVALLNNYLSTWLWAWGSNNTGQLGNGTNVDSAYPVQVSGLANMTAVASGDNHSISVKYDGTVWAWGNNANGQMGDGTTSPRPVPVQVNTLTGVQGITAGNQNSFASTTAGTVFAWGDNLFAQLGNGVGPDQLSPVTVTVP
jgi:alpha-tubulin suppressor-like RCC1 family protein